MKIILIFLLFKFITCSPKILKIFGELEHIDYETLFDDATFESKLILLAVVNENAKDEFDNRVDVLNELKKEVDKLNSNSNENQIELKAITSSKFVKSYSVFKYPQFFFFRKGNYVHYKGELTAQKIIDWIEKTMEKKTRTLTEASFEHDTQASTGATTGDWFVMFHNTSCSTKLVIEPNWELAALKLENQVNFAYVDLNKNPRLQKRFSVLNTPTVIFFKQGLMYRYDLGKFDTESLSSFSVKGWYKNVKAEKVPIELSWFDNLTDSIVKQLKELDSKQMNILIGSGLVLFLLMFFILYKILCSRNINKDSSVLSNIKID